MRPLLLLALCLAASALENPGEHMEQMDRDHQAAKEAYAKAWLVAADLSPIPVPHLEKDPRKSDADRAERIRTLNGQLLSMRRQRGEVLTYQEQQETGLVGAPAGPYQWAQIVAEADEVRGIARAETPPAPSTKLPAKEHHEPTAVFVKPADGR